MRQKSISQLRVDWIKSHVKHQGSDCLVYRFGETTKAQYLADRDLKANQRNRTPVNYMCTLAHGPAPADRPYAIQECGNDYCIHPQHLKWMNGIEKAEHFQMLRDEGLRDTASPGRPRHGE